MPTNIEITRRQRDILAASAFDIARAVYPDGSQPSLAYEEMAQLTWDELGDVSVEEIGAAMDAARALLTKK